LPGPKNRSPAEPELPDFLQVLCLSQGVRQRSTMGRPGGRWSKNSHRPLSHPPQRLVFRIEGLECSAPLVVSPFVESAGHRPLQAVELGFQSRVHGEIPLLPQPNFHSQLILNAGRYRRQWIVTRATLWFHAARAFRTAPEFSTYVSIAISLSNSESNGISSSKCIWNLAQSLRLTSVGSGWW